MSNKPNTKRAVETAAMTKEDLSKRIAAAKLELNKALVAGDPTAKLREYLRELEAEQKKLADSEDAQIAAKEAAQRDAQAAEAQRINEAAETLQEARDNRLAALSTRFAIPARPAFDSRNSFSA